MCQHSLPQRIVVQILAYSDALKLSSSCHKKMIAPACHIMAAAHSEMSTHESLCHIYPEKTCVGGDESIIILHT